MLQTIIVFVYIPPPAMVWVRWGPSPSQLYASGECFYWYPNYMYWIPVTFPTPEIYFQFFCKDYPNNKNKTGIFHIKVDWSGFFTG